MKTVNKTVISAVVVALFVTVLFAGTATAGFYVLPYSKDDASESSEHTVIVSHEGSDTESGTAFLAALDAITDASDSNRYLIVIQPGTYDVGSTPLQMKSYVNISGVGEDIVTITGNLGGDRNGIVKGVNNAELRFLRVENTHDGSDAVAVYNFNVSASFKMTNVTAESKEATNPCGVLNDNASPTMTDVTATAEGGNKSYGVYNAQSGPAMKNVTATATGGTGGNYGVYQLLGTAVITFSDITGDTNSVFVQSGSASITASRLDGDVSGSVTCKCVCDGSDTCYANTCP